MEDQLVEFIRRKEGASAPLIDWHAKKDEWIRSLEKLYDLIRQMLNGSVDPTALRSFTTEVDEDFLGTYSAPALELRIANERVEFLPKGVNVFGASGRVDIRGARGSVTLVRENSEQDRWSVIIQRTPQVRMVPLDRNSLKDSLERVMLP